MTESNPPTADERRRAVCSAMASGPRLIRFAARYTARMEDAEDAYQRALEIALRQAPVTERRRFMSWLYTVLRHEAIAVGRRVRREGPAAGEDVGAALDAQPADHDGPHLALEWRQRYRALQDALASLTEAQRICVILQSAGASYRAIEEITGFSSRKVERSVLEGRRSLHRWELKLAEGDVCRGLHEAIEGVADGTATDRERRSVRRHLKHCGPCSALLRRRRQANDWLGALVPGALVATEAEPALDPDPSPMFASWERAVGTAGFRLTQVAQLTTDLYAAATSKAGIGAAAVAVLGALSSPFAIDAVRGGEPPPDGAVVASLAPATEESPRPEAVADDPPAPATREPRRRARSGVPEPEPARKREASPEPEPARPTAPRDLPRTPPQPRVVAATPASSSPGRAAHPAPRRSSSRPAPTPPGRSSIALEFGP